MEFIDYLIKYQPLAYSTFKNALEQNHISHAYLIKGSDGAPLLECAKFFAKSLICKEGHPFACDKCLDCMRFDEGNYADFILLDGQKENIKIDDIAKLQDFFSQTPSEKSGKMIYIINKLENTNKESLNAILKFLEEPNENVYAFLTTNNEDKLLPTILSRAQHILLLPLPRQELLKEASEAGINKEDSEILINFYNDINTLNEVASSDLYLSTKEYVFSTLNMMAQSLEKGLFYVETNVIPNIKTKEGARLYLDILSLAFKDMMKLKYNMDINLISQKLLLGKLVTLIKDIDKCYREIMFTRGQIELNVNLSLLLEHVFISVCLGE